jgi:pimeloyl-ACP methyl ester carboxylesterase
MRAAIALALIAGVFSAGQAQAAEKPEIVLVHGAFEDASVWKGVAAGLQKDGYRVKAVDLPGRPSNPKSPAELSLAVYADAVLADIGAEARPVVLVGHSFGGMVISKVAEEAPNRIRSLVYVAAYLPRDGQSLLALATSDKDSEVGPHLQIDKTRGLASIEYSARAELFANDGPASLKAAIPPFIVDEPLAPLAEPVAITQASAGVPKAYVFTKRDQVVSPALQQEMTKATTVTKRFTLDTGHTPFLTDVPGLVQAIEASAD